MQRANTIGFVVSIVAALVWVLVAVTGLSWWVGLVVSVLAGLYWAFGRRLVVGGNLQAAPRRTRNRGR